MRLFLASTLVILASAPFTFASPLTAETVETSPLTETQQRKLNSFAFVAGIKCLVAKLIRTPVEAERIIAYEIDADDITFLKNKRVDSLLNSLSKYLYDTTDKCTSKTEEIMIKENTKLFQEVVELIKK